MIERFERFSLSILEIYRSWHKLAAEEMEEFGLKGTHSIYLITFSNYPEGLTAPQICEICARDKSEVSRMMAIMEEKGIVTKEGKHQNLYGGLFKLTERGKLAAEHLRKRVKLAVELAGRHMTEENRAVFYDGLESITTNLHELSREGLPKE